MKMTINQNNVLPTWIQDTTQKTLCQQLLAQRSRWLVTGAAGFIGSNLVEALLMLGQEVRGLDNFSTGHQYNLDEVRECVGEQRWRDFTFIEADVRNLSHCTAAVKQIDYVLHQAALGSVPRSVNDPLTSNEVNVTGFLNMLDAARCARVRRFVYAASSSTYGDEPNLPKREDRIGLPLSPYAVTKLVDEIYAGVYARTYGFGSIGLRYFNVFGRRQDPAGAYAAVIPKWITAMLAGGDVEIFGDGETSRDFCYIDNIVQANLRAALYEHNSPPTSEIYNVAVGGRTTLNQLFEIIDNNMALLGVEYHRQPVYREPRAGDVRHSQADVSRARAGLGYLPLFDLKSGIKEALPWYINMLTYVGKHNG